MLKQSKSNSRSKKISLLISRAVFIAAVIFALWQSAQAAPKQIVLSEGSTATIDISAADLNLIKVPADGIKVMTSSDNVQVKIDGRNVFIKFSGEMLKPVSVFLVMPHNSYPVLLMPKQIPAAMVVVDMDGLRLPSEDNGSELRSSDYVSDIKSIIKGLYLREPSQGFQMVDIQRDVTKFRGTSDILISEHKGGDLVGEIHIFRNLTQDTLSLSPNKFWEKGIAAVSVGTHVLEPGEATELLIVRQAKVSNSGKRNSLNVLDRYSNAN